MADNLDLQIVIDTLLNSKGFEDAQAGLKGLTGATNDSAAGVTRSAGAQKNLARELGGTRGAAADLTRVLLMNLGVTGAAGEVAKTVGMSMTSLGMAINPVTLAASALVAVAALLIPKLIDWAKSGKDTAKANADLREAIAAMLPDLAEYVRLVPNATEELKKLFQVSRDEAFRKQKTEIADLTAALAENEKQVARLLAGTTKVAEGDILSGVSKRVVIEATAEQKVKAEELNIVIEDQRAKLNALLAAQEDSVLLNDQIRSGLDNEKDRREKVKKAIEEQRREQERLNKVRADDLQLAFRLRVEMFKEANERLKQNKKETETAAERLLLSELLKGAYFEEAQQAVASAKIKRAVEAEAFAASSSYYLSFFTQNKAVRIAQAIADTYAAATRALAEGGPYFGPVLAAAMVAAGLKNVAEIRKTDIGFDDPVNDMLAARLGRKFAMDVLSHINAGFGTGLHELSRTGGSVINQTTTINRGTTMNVTANGVIGSRTAFRSWLEREMTLAERGRARKSI